MYGVNSDAVQLDVNVNNVSLDIDTAVACGLIINELVSNSLKYAFPKGKKGKICIILRKDGSPGNLYSLVVGDNGVGFPRDLDIFLPSISTEPFTTICLGHLSLGNIAA